jgi:hypothetical protein
VMYWEEMTPRRWGYPWFGTSMMRCLLMMNKGCMVWSLGVGNNGWRYQRRVRYLEEWTPISFSMLTVSSKHVSKTRMSTALEKKSKTPTVLWFGWLGPFLSMEIRNGKRQELAS